MVKDLAHDGPYCRPGTAVLQNHRHRDLRVVIRGKRRHQLVVTQTFGNAVRVIGFVGFQTKDLRSTGLRRHFVRRTGEILVGGTVGAVCHAVHTVFRDLPEAGMNVTHRRFVRLVPRHFFAVFNRTLQQVRHFHHAVIDEDHHGFVHLKRRCRPVTLTDTHRNGVALIPRFFKALQLPFARRHVAGAFFRQVNAGVVSVAEFAHPF